MSTIKGIFFDAAGIFYDRTVSATTFLRRRLTELGYPSELSMEDGRRRKQMQVLATEGRLGYEEYWDTVLAMHGVRDPARRLALKKEILACIFDVFAYPGGRTALAGMQARGFIIGIVTDTIYPVQWKMEWLNKVGVAEFIQVVACSTTLGAHKPQPEMYLNAVRQAGLTPAQSAFVGHDAHELEGARRAGLATVAVNYAPDARADYYADSLPGLLDVPIFQSSIEPGSM